MGGSARYRYGKKIAEAKANGASDDVIRDLERRRDDAIARENERRAQKQPQATGRLLVGKNRPRNTARATGLMRYERYADIIERTRQTEAAFAERLKNARPISERPKGVKMQEWLMQNPDLDHGLRLIKRELNVLRKRMGRRSEESIIHMPKPENYDRNTQRITYKAGDREAVEQAVRTIEKELKLDLGFAMNRIDWVE